MQRRPAKCRKCAGGDKWNWRHTRYTCDEGNRSAHRGDETREKYTFTAMCGKIPLATGEYPRMTTKGPKTCQPAAVAVAHPIGKTVTNKRSEDRPNTKPPETYSTGGDQCS